MDQDNSCKKPRKRCNKICRGPRGPRGFIGPVGPVGPAIGIVECTVGNVSNPNVQYNSVQAALDDGCLFIRIVDGLSGGQVPGYIEPGPINFTGVGVPTMIYIDPGVDWVLRESFVGGGGINVSGVSVAFRGSGWQSRMVIEHNVGASTLFTSDGATELFFYDMNLSSDDILPALVPAGVFGGSFFFSNCECESTTFTGLSYFFDVSNSVEWEWNSCRFLGASTGVGSSLRMIGPAGHNSLLIADCQAIGEFATSGGTPVSGSSGFEIDGGTSFTSVNGLVFSQNAFDVDLIVGDGLFSHIQDSGFGALNVLCDASNTQLSGLRSGGLLVVNDSSNIFSDFQCDTLLVTSGSINEFNNGQVTTTINTTGSGVVNKFVNMDVAGVGTMVLGGQNTKVVSCRVGTLTVNAQECAISNSVLTGITSLVVNTNEVQITGCNIGGLVSIGAAAIAPDCVFTGNNFIGPVVHGSAFSAVRCTYSGNLFQPPGLSMFTRARGDGCVFSGNNFIPGSGVIIGADATAVPPLFVGNITAGAGNPANSNAASTGNV